MNGRYAVAIGDNVIVWEDGAIKCENEKLKNDLIELENRERLKPYMEINLDGSLLYSGEWIRPSKNWALFYGFLQDVTGGDLKFIAGDRPSWEALGHKPKDGEIN